MTNIHVRATFGTASDREKELDDLRELLAEARRAAR